MSELSHGRGCGGGLGEVGRWDPEEEEGCAAMFEWVGDARSRCVFVRRVDAPLFPWVVFS